MSTPSERPSQGANDNRGRGRSNTSDNRNRGRSNNSRRENNSESRSPGVPSVPKSKFIGKEESLGNEFVYQHTDGRDASDQFTTTTEEIVRYSSTKYKSGADVERSLANGVKVTIEMPTAPTAVGEPAVISPTEMMMWKMKLQLALQRTSLLDANLESAYALIKGQCSKPMLEKVVAQVAYADVHASRDPIGLLAIIKGVMFHYNSKKYRSLTSSKLLEASFAYIQG
jgi:hypothetical protein